MAMVDWLDFRKQSQSDMAACNLLYEYGDYGNAAYHLQQAVEKHTKFILSQGGVMSERERTHLPISGFLEEFVDMMNNFDIIAEKYNNQFLDAENLRERRTQLIDQTRIIMKALTPKERKRSYRCALWKNSLNIPLVDMQEEAVFQRCHIFGDRRRAQYKLNMLHGWLNETAKSNFDNAPEIKRMYHYKTIVEFAPLIAATYPHAEIGRYPDDIMTRKGLKNSVELYKEHKGELRELIELVEKTYFRVS